MRLSILIWFRRWDPERGWLDDYTSSIAYTIQGAKISIAKRAQRGYYIWSIEAWTDIEDEVEDAAVGIRISQELKAWARERGYWPKPSKLPDLMPDGGREPSEYIVHLGEDNLTESFKQLYKLLQHAKRVLGEVEARLRELESELRTFGLMPDGGGVVSYPRGELQERGKTIVELVEELEGLVEEALSQLEARLEDLKRVAIPGKLRQKYVSCGKPNCSKCPHGPYWYLRTPDGKERYVRREDVPYVRAGIEAWEEAQKLEAELGALRERWKAIRAQLEWLALDLSYLTPCPGAPHGGKTHRLDEVVDDEVRPG